MNSNDTDPRIEKYIASKRKSPAAAFLLALLLGPLGSIYGAPLGGSILTLATVVLALSGLGIVAGLLGWLFALVLGPAGASDHNTRVKAEAQLLLAGGAR